VYPNYRNAPDGMLGRFWHYDPEENGWYAYGAGVMRGRQFVPEPSVRGFYEFTGAMTEQTNPPPAQGPAPGGPKDGEPVDVWTGLFLLERTDLFLPDVLPISLRRTYRPGDVTVRSFGIGTSHDYRMYLWSAQQYQEVDLILPDGGRVHYVRVSAGTNYWTAEFEHTGTPTVFFKSRIKWNGAGWDLTMKDGTVFAFGSEAPLQSIRDRFGNTVRLSYSSTNGFGNGVGNLTRVESPNGRWIEFSSDGSSRITQARDNIGRTVTYEYDAIGRLWKVSDPSGGITEYTYDSSHRMLTLKDARGITFLRNQYDANGRVSQQTMADSSTFGFAYTLDQNGKATEVDVTNQRGYLTRTTFSGNGYPLTLIEAVGTSVARTTTAIRNSTSNFVTSVTDPLNRQTDYTYDSSGNMTSVTHLVGTSDAVTTTWTYEPAFHLVATVTDPLNHTTSFTYDVLGRLTSISDPLGHETTLTHNAAGQPLTITSPLNKTTTFGYAMGNLVSISSPLGNVTNRFVDGAGRVLGVTNQAGAIIRFEYDVLNRPTTVIDPLAGETSSTYDENGNLLTFADARGKTTTWTYDNMDRPATRTDPLSRSESVVYDERGNLVTWTDRKGQTTTYHYDAFDRRTFVGFGTTGAPPTYASTIATSYVAGDRATALVDSLAGTIERSYDLQDRVTEEETPEGVLSYTYDDADRRTTMTVAGQTVVSYSYDDANRLTGLTRGSASVTIAYDDGGRRTSLTLPNGIVAEYGYDDDSRLTGLTYKQGMSTLGTLTYAYDVVGRRTHMGGTYARTSLPAALASAGYDDAKQIATFGGVSFAYDDNGNLTSDGTRSYTWNARGRLAAVSGAASASFLYDAIGRRREKTVSATTAKFLYDGSNLVQELSGTTPITNLLTGLSVDEIFAREMGSGTTTPLVDALGSSLAMTNSSGILATSYTYEPFGATTMSGTASTNTSQFTARENDDTGLYYFRTRYYDAYTGRFVSQDPLGERAGSNLYSYVGNQPTGYIDPYGLLQVCCRPVNVIGLRQAGACHCFLKLSDGTTLGGYNEYGTLPKRENQRDDKCPKDTPDCTDVPGADEGKVRQAFNNYPSIGIYLMDGTSNTVPAEVARAAGVPAKLPPCAIGRGWSHRPPQVGTPIFW
jgi:RHS repeat-associated protein